MVVLPDGGCSGLLARIGLGVVVVDYGSQASPVAERKDMLAQFCGLPCVYVGVQCWWDPPLQVQMSIRAPLAVPAPTTSRQSPDPTPVTVPLLLRVHCWFVPPLQSQMSTLLPGEVAAPATSRHLLP